MKQTILIFLFLLQATFSGYAQQDFTQLDWNALRMDSVLPHYTEVVPLETDYHLFDYVARVRYPEWGKLTDKEVTVASRFDSEIGDTLCLHTSVGISRGQGLLDIDFIPIVRSNGKYQKLLSGKIEIVPIPHARKVAARQADETTQRWASSSVLGSGKWVKIQLTDDGIYHLTNSQLRAMGFSNPQNIRVYGYGGHQQDEIIHADTDWDDLPPVSLLPVADGYLFHANGLLHWKKGRHVQNHYARAASYFITEASTAVPAFPELAAENPTSIDSLITTYQANIAHDPQEYAWYQGGWQLYEAHDYASSNTRKYELTLPTYSVDEAEAKLTIAFTANNEETTKVSPTLNGKTLTSFEVSANTSEYNAAIEAKKTYSVDGLLQTNTLRLTTPSGVHARLNYLELSYTGLLKIDDSHPYLQFTHTTGDQPERLCIEYSAIQAPEVWRLDEMRQPAMRLKTTEQVTDGRHLLLADIEADGIAHRYAVFDRAAFASYPQHIQRPLGQ